MCREDLLRKRAVQKEKLHVYHRYCHCLTALAVSGGPKHFATRSNSSSNITTTNIINNYNSNSNSNNNLIDSGRCKCGGQSHFAFVTVAVVVGRAVFVVGRAGVIVVGGGALVVCVVTWLSCLSAAVC